MVTDRRWETQRPRFFPDPLRAHPLEPIAETDSLSLDLLLEAYSRGIFPWSESPVRWYSPDPRAVFVLDRIHLPSRLGKLMRKHHFRVTFDQAFSDVVRGCADAHAHEGEWITEGFVNAYSELHNVGHAHSVEVWRDESLVGGLYGVQLGGLFAGESMFYQVSGASKVAFAYLVRQVRELGIVLFDAQVLTEHTLSLGAVLVHRFDYLRVLPYALRAPVKIDGQRWPSDPPPWTGSGR